MKNLAHIIYKGIKSYKKVNNKRKIKVVSSYLVDCSIFEENSN